MTAAFYGLYWTDGCMLYLHLRVLFVAALGCFTETHGPLQDTERNPVTNYVLVPTLAVGLAREIRD